MSDGGFSGLTRTRNLTDLADRAFLQLVVEQRGPRCPGNGRPIEPGLISIPGILAATSCGLGLAVAVVNRELEMLAPDLDDLGIERLARGGAMAQRRQLDASRGPLHQHPVLRGRRAETS